jgi:hypothetical protein
MVLSSPPLNVVKSRHDLLPTGTVWVVLKAVILRPVAKSMGQDIAYPAED